jgi:hypothetical protein
MRRGASSTRRSRVTNVPNAGGVSPVNGAAQDESHAMIRRTRRQIISVADTPSHDRSWAPISKEDRMGLVLFPGDDDVTSPDVSWSYTGFNMFRQWLAQAEGFTLTEMDGFGGDRPWSSVSTTLAPLLDHPDDDGPDLTPAQCAAMLPRLEAVIDQRRRDGSDSVLQRRIEDVLRLVAVMRFCLDKDVELIFG